MAQTGSAQREPSMEEILASIRRIIEDSDTARQPLEEAPDEGPQLAAPASASVVQHEVEAFRAEFDEAGAGRAPDVEPPAQESMQPQAGLPEADMPVSQPQQPAILTFDAPGMRLSQEPQAMPDFSASQSGPAGDLPDAASDQAGDSPAVAPAASAWPEHANPDDAGEQAVGQGETRPSLLSDHAGRQVAASFGELSEAFAASRRRSFDEMAEEMLRPMLQDWLDNNLPTLVEKLVREEIERVARGG